MIKRIALVTLGSIVGVFFASMQAIARETRFAFAEAKFPSGPDPFKHPLTEFKRTALADTTRKPALRDLAEYGPANLLSSREKRRKKGRGNHTQKAGNKKESARYLSMKSKSR